MKDFVNFADLLSLKDKSAIVTGGAKGIGKAIALRLGQAGANVLISDLDVDILEQTTKEFSEKGINISSLVGDVANEEDTKQMIQHCQDEFGSVDILVNNAGIYPSKSIQEMTKEEFERVVDVNLQSVFLTTKYSAEVMKSQGGGKIINITSIDALHPSMIGLSHYDASKHGVWGFTKSSALELAKYNIWINAIAPGGITTPGVKNIQNNNQQMSDSIEDFTSTIPMKRFGEPDEIAKVALFLASSMSSYMTGEQIVVDGGKLLT